MAHNLSGYFVGDDEFGAAFRENGEVVKGYAYIDYYTKEYIAGKQMMEFDLAGFPVVLDGITGTVRHYRGEDVLRNIDTGKTTGWFTFGLKPEDTRYGLTIGSTVVTAANCTDIRDAAIKAGKVSYDLETATLTLDGVTFDGGGTDGIDVQRIDETTIKLVGTSTMKNAITGLRGMAALKLTSDNGKGMLNIQALACGISAPGVTITHCKADVSAEETGITTFTSGDLTIDNADVTVKGTGEWGGAICYIRDLVLGKGETIVSPVGAQLNPESNCVELNGEKVREIVFKGMTQGDVNGDGTVDVADIASVISIMAGGAGTDPVSARNADVNGDGTVDVADIANIISIMAANARRLNTDD